LGDSITTQIHESLPDQRDVIRCTTSHTPAHNISWLLWTVASTTPWCSSWSAERRSPQRQLSSQKFHF